MYEDISGLLWAVSLWLLARAMKSEVGLIIPTNRDRFCKNYWVYIYCPSLLGDTRFYTVTLRRV